MDKTDAVMDLAKRRGFLFPSFEAYGGLAGFYDYGPLGAAMKRRFEDLWRHTFLDCAVPMAEVACPRVTLHEVLKASGHVDEFTDLVVRCANGHPSRADHLVESAGYEGNADALDAAAIDEQVAALGAKCPVCGAASFSPAAPLNLMFNTEVGPGSGRTGYLRPETAQGIFTDFPHLLRHFRGKLPFGGIQLGGSNRNEISPRQGMIRLREFHMMEAEVFFTDTGQPFPPLHEEGRCAAETTFVDGHGRTHAMSFREAARAGTGRAGEDGRPRALVGNEPLAYFLAVTHDFLVRAGMDPQRLRFRQHEKDEMAHYARDCWDAEFRSERHGWVECVGVADRGCYDLGQHIKATGRFADFSVAVPVEPVDIDRAVPVMKELGKRYKGQAKDIAARLVEAEREAAVRAGLPLEDVSGWPEKPSLDQLVARKERLEAPAGGIESPTVGGEVLDAACCDVVRERVHEVRRVPRVIEPSFGVDRILYALWEHAYERGEKNGEPYTVMHLSPAVAPVQAAVLPLTSRDGLPERAKAIERDLRRAGLTTDYDESGNIGRRYARQDEVGTPWCVTIDPETASDGTVTVRDRDTTEQVRVPIGDLAAHLRGGGN